MVQTIKMIGLSAVMFTFLNAIVKELFMSRDSNEFLFVHQIGVPLIVFQTLFLSALTSLMLPFYFKLQGTVVYGSISMRVEKGFDEGIHR